MREVIRKEITVITPEQGLLIDAISNAIVNDFGEVHMKLMFSSMAKATQIYNNITNDDTEVYIKHSKLYVTDLGAMSSVIRKKREVSFIFSRHTARSVSKEEVKKMMITISKQGR
jgi:hypothetical protein